MDYQNLRSIVEATKRPIPLKNESASFSLPEMAVTPYIAPTFTKDVWPSERPAIVLVSAVGASGKTTTARSLSFHSHLPILDLARHKPVGDNTLTGVLTSAYRIEDVAAVLDGLQSGAHGILIDGIDEGRSKTTEEGFEAFLDDLIERSRGAQATTIVVFGRSQVIQSAWCYLDDKRADVGLVSIDPFNLEGAKRYIDAYVLRRNANQQETYEAARDGVLDKLGNAFSRSNDDDNAFLSFIGYPPVLDAIATLLDKEQNYHTISEALSGDLGDDLEVKLLLRIADFLMERDRTDKAHPNFIRRIVAKADARTETQLLSSLYSADEQCARVLALAMNQRVTRRCVDDGALHEEYESAVEQWLPEHPFLSDNRLRNSVFEAVAMVRCALSGVSEYAKLALDYAAAHRPTYHVLYFMWQLARQHEIDGRFFNLLIQSCSEFLASHCDIAIEINGDSWEESDEAASRTAELELGVTFPRGSEERNFAFKGTVDSTGVMPIGPYLVNAAVTVPCSIELVGARMIECVGPCHITARSVQLNTSDLVVRAAASSKRSGHDAGLFMNVERVDGHAGNISPKGATVEITCCEHGLDFPLARHVHRQPAPLRDPAMAGKFLRLRRIMLEFRSHGRGGLAKFRAKIEHERVLRNRTGRNVLNALLREGVLRVDPKFYYVDPELLSEKLGITWQQLRHHESSAQLEEFLKAIA